MSAGLVQLARVAAAAFGLGIDHPLERRPQCARLLPCVPRVVRGPQASGRELRARATASRSDGPEATFKVVEATAYRVELAGNGEVS